MRPTASLATDKRKLLIVSRMNHDCRPNAHYYWDPDTFTQNVFATRDILAGEEITITYVE
jgi:SET domain-containing protein